MQERLSSREEAARPPQKPLASWYAQGLSDGLGDRLLMFDNSGAPSLELLRFRADLADIPGFEAALRDQVKRLAPFQHSAFTRVRSVQRLEPDDDLALVSHCPDGKRLSDVLHRTRGPAFASALVRQLGPALTALQQHGAGSTHGLLSTDRIVVSPEGRLTITEHAVGPALDTLGLGSGQLASMGIALPPTANGWGARLDIGTDWYQLGLVAVSVLIGRPVTNADLPQLQKLLDTVAYSARVDGSGLSPFMRHWLDRALQLSGERIESGADARAALAELLRKESPHDSRDAIAPRREREETSPHALLSGVEPPNAVVDTIEEDAAPSVPEWRQNVSTAPVPADDLVLHFPVEPEPAREAPRETPFVQSRNAPEPPAPPPAPLISLEQEALAGKRLIEGRSMATSREVFAPPPEPRHQRRVPISLVVGLAVVAVVEAGVIAWMARAQWRAEPQPITVEATPSGDQLVSTRSSGGAPIRLTVAPDLRWVRVLPPTTDRVLGGKRAGTGPGALRVSSPIPLKVMAGTRLLGSVPGADLRIPEGRHEIALVNAELGVDLKQALDVVAGEIIALHVAPPHGWVTIDATPWAEVSIDGQPVGRTPLGPLPLSLGDHQITFRHPAGSKDQQKITVKSEVTTRVTGNLRF